MQDRRRCIPVQRSEPHITDLEPHLQHRRHHQELPYRVPAALGVSRTAQPATLELPQTGTAAQRLCVSEAGG